LITPKTYWGRGALITQKHAKGGKLPPNGGQTLSKHAWTIWLLSKQAFKTIQPKLKFEVAQAQPKNKLGVTKQSHKSPSNKL
jgi:hypothetical protein